MDCVSDENYFACSDIELVEMVRRGDEYALQEIRDRYQHRLYQTALIMLGSPDNAEKAVKQIWQQSVEKLHEYKNETLFITWICKALIKHILHNYLHRDQANAE